MKHCLAIDLSLHKRPNLSLLVVQLCHQMKERFSFMNKNLTEIVYILDRSGSMSGLEKDTIGGYNSFLKKQKNLVLGQKLILILKR